MSKFRKKPIVVEAELFLPSVTPWPEGVYEFEGKYLIRTMEGEMQLAPGDWVITGVKGEHYGCDGMVFDMTYESVDEQE